MRTLIVAPTPREAAALGPGALVCGAGNEAAATVDARLRAGDVGLVVIAGVCGGLDPSLAAGGIVLARSVIASGRPERASGPALFDAVRRSLLRARAPFVSSSLLTVERPLATRRDKTDAWNAYGAAGVDMETYVIAEAAEARGVRWLAVRAVLDPAGSSLPASLRAWHGESDADVVRGIARRPQEWASYARLALRMRAALRALAAAMPALLAAAEDLEHGATAFAREPVPVIAAD